MSEKEVKIIDTTLGSSLSTSEILPIAPKIDEAGYYSVYVMDPATFEACLRDLDEDPWQRLGRLKDCFKKTPLLMLLNGPSIVSFQPQPDDLLKSFIDKSIDYGIDIFRLSDPLSNLKNLEAAITFIKEKGGHPQGNLCYTLSPVHTLDYYLEQAKLLAEMGIDSLYISDSTGLLTPSKAYELVRALKEEIKIPLGLSLHSSTDLSLATSLEAIRAGCDLIDSASLPLSLHTGQPSVQTLARVLSEANRPSRVNLDITYEIARSLKKADQVSIETDAALYHLPFEIIKEIRDRLLSQNRLSRIKEVLNEVREVHKELGYPPLSSPVSNIISAQALLNSITGERYKIVSKEVRAYVRGDYGQSPAEIDADVKDMILGKKEEQAMPKLNFLKLKKGLAKSLVEKEEDFITYALFPNLALTFFKWRKNPENNPSPSQKEAMKGFNLKDRDFLEKIINFAKEDNIAELDIWEKGKRIRIKRAEVPAPAKETPPLAKEELAVEKEVETPLLEEDYERIVCPLSGTFYRSSSPETEFFVEVGDNVRYGDTLALVEAMKMFNEIKSEVQGQIVEILALNTEVVQEGRLLFLIKVEDSHLAAD